MLIPEIKTDGIIVATVCHHIIDVIAAILQLSLQIEPHQNCTLSCGDFLLKINLEKASNKNFAACAL